MRPEAPKEKTGDNLKMIVATKFLLFQMQDF